MPTYKLFAVNSSTSWLQAVRT